MGPLGWLVGRLRDWSEARRKRLAQARPGDLGALCGCIEESLRAVDQAEARLALVEGSAAGAESLLVALKGRLERERCLQARLVVSYLTLEEEVHRAALYQRAARLKEARQALAASSPVAALSLEAKSLDDLAARRAVRDRDIEENA